MQNKKSTKKHTKSEKYQADIDYFMMIYNNSKMIQSEKMYFVNGGIGSLAQKKIKITTNPLKQLTQTNFKGLKVGTVTLSVFIKLKLVTPCVKLDAIQVMCEDQIGEQCVLVSIYNFDRKGKHLDDIFSIGNIIYVK